jgi:hypothetical protein
LPVRILRYSQERENRERLGKRRGKSQSEGDEAQGSLTGSKEGGKGQMGEAEVRVFGFEFTIFESKTDVVTSAIL